MLLNSSPLEALLVGLVALLSTRGSTGQLNESPPDCNSGMDNINKCINAATAASAATKCNWYRLIGPFSDCIIDAVAGCQVDEQDIWYQYVIDFNKTLAADGCNPSCTNQNTRGQQMDKCFSTANFEQLVSNIYSTPDVQGSDPNCLTLYTMNACLISSTSGCPALTDIAHDRIYYTANSAAVYSMCGIAIFPAATSSAPVALFDANSMMPDPPTPTKSPGDLPGSELLLVILGSIVIITTIIVVIIVIILTIRRRRAVYRSTLLKDWRPNGHKIYRDEPQVPPAHNGNLYRPIAISHNGGFVDETVHVQ